MAIKMKKLLIKDCILSIRTGWPLILFVVALSGLLYTVVYSDMELEYIEISIKSGVIYSGAYVIPVVAMLLIQSTFAEEKKNKIIQVLIANQFLPSLIWLSKFMVSYAIGYICYAFSLIVNEIAVYFTFGIVLKYSYDEVLLMAFIMPLICLGGVALLWFVMWITKNLGIMLIGFVPTFLYLIAIYGSVYIVENNIDISIGLALLLAVVAFVCIFIIINLVKHISTEYIVNIQG